MKALLTGASGQLGQELRPGLESIGTLVTVDRIVTENRSSNDLKMDLADLNQVEILLNRIQPDLIVNAAAYTAVDQAEDDTQACFRLNAELPGCMARWSSRNDCMMLHYSTDYVFDGASDRPYVESDFTFALNTYGESKLAGEWAIDSSRCRHIILRTSWVYSGHGNNFVLSMLRLARELPSLNIVSDQSGCPTWARNLAEVSCRLARRVINDPSSTEPFGLWHYCDATVTTWYDFAHLIFSIALDLGLLERMPEMHPVDSSAFPQVAERPRFSVLDTSALREVLGIEPADLNQSLRHCLEELVKHDKK